MLLPLSSRSLSEHTRQFQPKTHQANAHYLNEVSVNWWLFPTPAVVYLAWLVYMVLYRIAYAKAKSLPWEALGSRRGKGRLAGHHRESEAKGSLGFCPLPSSCGSPLFPTLFCRSFPVSDKQRKAEHKENLKTQLVMQLCKPYISLLFK